MKRTLLISLLVVCLSITLKLSAQTEWAPVGAKWHYEIYYNNGSAETYLTLESIGDTSINGITCKILDQKCIRDLFPDRRYYTYKDQNKVYVFDGSDFRVLYDFTVQPGTDWIAYGPNLYQMCDTLINVQVDSAGIEELNGFQFNYQIVEIDDIGWTFGCGPGQSRISEKFGSYNFMFPQYICIIDAPYPCYLRCYEDSEFGFYSTGYADSCTYEYGVGIKEIELADNIKIGPNPATDILNIELLGNIENSRFSIYSSTGKLINSKNVSDHSTRIDISTYKQGTYILKIYHEGIFSAGKIIKM